MFPPIQPPLARPLFLEQEERSPLVLEQEERRLQGNPNVGDQPPIAYAHMFPQAYHENVELRRGLEVLMDENRKLRERVELLENSNGEEAQKFSTPNGESEEAVRPPRSAVKPKDYSEAETTKEAARPRKLQEPREAETTKEAARPPRSAAKLQDPVEAETSKEAERPPKTGMDRQGNLKLKGQKMMNKRL